MVIGLGFQKRHGKSTVAKDLVRLGFKELSFAGPLKQAVIKLYGVPSPYCTAKKDSIIPHVGKSFRTLCEEMGFMLRKFYGDEFIVAILEQKLKKYIERGYDVVISDVRHPKEYALIEQYGGFPVRVVNPSVKTDTEHLSETQLLNINWPYTIVNNKGLKELRQETYSLVAELKKKE